MRTLARLAKRDVAFVGLARSAAEKRFRNRMGWQFRCVPAHKTQFQRDPAVSFSDHELASGKADYNVGGKPRVRIRQGPASLARTLRARFSTARPMGVARGDDAYIPPAGPRAEG